MVVWDNNKIVLKKWGQKLVWNDTKKKNDTMKLDRGKYALFRKIAFRVGIFHYL